MKKILFFMLALLAFVACDNMYGGADDPTAADVAGDVTIEFSAVGDYGFTVTLTPTKAASFYSYLVDDDDVDVSAELDAETLYECGYSSVAKGTVNYSENPSYTFTLDGLDSDQTYYVYAVAGSPEGNVGSIVSASVVTNYVPVYEVYVSGEFVSEENILTATVVFTDDVESVRVALVEGEGTEDEVEAALDAVIDGTVDYKTVTESGEVQFSVSVDGSYIVMAVAYGGGEAQTFDYDVVSVDHWHSLGICTYRDDFMATYYFYDELTCFEYEVEIQESDNTPGLFRLVNPYGSAYPIHNEESWNKFWAWLYYDYYGGYNPFPWDDEDLPYDDSKNYYMEINASDPDGVYIDLQNTGMDYGDGWIYVYSFASYYMDYGYSLEEIKAEGLCGTYANGVITFPDDALLMYEPGYSSYVYTANYFGMFRVVMPGVIVKDYSVDIEYNGKFTDTRDRNYAVATIELGEDVDYAITAMVEGKDYDAAIAAVIDGTLEGQTITESGSVEFACEDSGTYTIVVVAYADDEPQESAYVTFTYSIVAPDWKLYGTGEYSYYLYVEGSDPDLELYQSNDDPTKFRITNWLYDVNFDFTWDQTTNEIVVDEDLYTGMEHSRYGSIYVCDFIDDSGYDYYGCTPSYYKDGIFYFSLEYYCSAGLFCYGYETFILDGASFGLTTADLGSYYTFEVSGFDGTPYYAEYALEASDNSRYGNVMFTVFDDFDCDVSPIYGDFDEDTGVLSFMYGQQFTNYGGYNFWFYTYYDYYAYFLLLNNGDFWGPFWGEMAGSAYGDRSPAYYWDLYMFMYGCKESSGPNSIRPASASELHSSREHSLDESRPTSVKPNSGRINYTKQKFQKPAKFEGDIVLASSSTKSSDNSSKKVRSGAKQAPVQSPDVKDKKTIKDSIKESKGWNN